MKQAEDAQLLLEFIEHQQCLTNLSFSEYILPPDLTTALMGKLCNSQSFDTLKNVFLRATCNFAENESCELLANFIANAPSLKELNIAGPDNKIKIVTVWTDDEGNTGWVRVTKDATKEFIC